MRKGAFEHALSGVRVQAPFGARVQKVQRVQRVEVGASKLLKAPSLYKTFTTALRASEMHSPFGGWRHHLSPASGGTITRAYCRAAYEETAFQSFIVPPLSGGKVVP